MGGVELSDQVFKPYSAIRKSHVWYKKLAVHITQTALYNMKKWMKVSYLTSPECMKVLSWSQ